MSTLLLRADGGIGMGAGHVLRCLALAQGWQAQGGRALFATAAEHPALATRLRREGCGLRCLRGDAGSSTDAASTIALAREAGARWVVVDGYHFDASYQASIKEAGLRVLWIDDEAHAGPYVADLVLNQNLHATEALYAQRGDATQLLLGTRYTLLRREFTRHRPMERETPATVRRILVTLGGGDAENITLEILRALNDAALADLRVEVVTGGLNPHLPMLQSWSKQSRLAVEFLHDVTDMTEPMTRADLAISAAGSTAWELAFLGVPSCLVAVAANQLPVAEQLAAQGAAVNLGPAAELSLPRLAATVRRLAADAERRRELTVRGKHLVDGDGAARVVAHLCGDSLRLRPVEHTDRQLLWEWANDPDVRAFAFNPEPIPWEDHVRWFDHRMASPESLHFLAVDRDDVPVGQVRFDLKKNNEVSGGEAEIHIAVAQGFRGGGHGSTLLRLAAEKLFRETSVETIRALIQPRNGASLRAFENAGFRPHGKVTAKGHEARQYLLARHSTA